MGTDAAWFFTSWGPVYFRHLRLLTPGLSTENTLSAPIPYSTDASSAFFNSIKEVYNASLILTPEQRTHANYWRGTPDGSAPAYCYFILLKILIEHGNEAMLDKAAFAYCKIGITLSDAAISCFKENYQYNQLRPVTYIRNVIGHATWNSLIPAPPTPAYPDFMQPPILPALPF